MTTFLNFVFVWYMIGVAVLVLAAYLDWSEGDDLRLGEVLGCIFVAALGPILLIPMCEYLGISGAIKASWKNRMNSPVLRGRRRDRE